MAWIVAIPPSPRHPRERYQVRFQDGKRQRSAGTYSTKPRALAEKRAIERIFTSPGGSRGPGGTLAGNTFARVWKRALSDAELSHAWPEYGGLHFHDLRHTHATWLIALRVPMIAVAGRLGHANTVVTMMVYAHVDKLVDRGLLTTGELGLAAPEPVVPLPRRAG